MSLDRQALLTNSQGRQNFAVSVNTGMMPKQEKLINACLQIRKCEMYEEEDLQDECIQNYGRNLNSFNLDPPVVYRISKKQVGERNQWEITDLNYIIMQQQNKLGVTKDDFKLLSKDEKTELYQRREVSDFLTNVIENLRLRNIDTNVKELQNEIQTIQSVAPNKKVNFRKIRKLISQASLQLLGSDDNLKVAQKLNMFDKNNSDSQPTQNTGQTVTQEDHENYSVSDSDETTTKKDDMSPGTKRKHYKEIIDQSKQIIQLNNEHKRRMIAIQEKQISFASSSTSLLKENQPKQITPTKVSPNPRNENSDWRKVLRTQHKLIKKEEAMTNRLNGDPGTIQMARNQHRRIVSKTRTHIKELFDNCNKVNKKKYVSLQKFLQQNKDKLMLTNKSNKDLQNMVHSLQYLRELRETSPEAFTNDFQEFMELFQKEENQLKQGKDIKQRSPDYFMKTMKGKKKSTRQLLKRERQENILGNSKIKRLRIENYQTKGYKQNKSQNRSNLGEAFNILTSHQQFGSPKQQPQTNSLSKHSIKHKSRNLVMQQPQTQQQIEPLINDEEIVQIKKRLPLGSSRGKQSSGNNLYNIIGSKTQNNNNTWLSGTN